MSSFSPFSIIMNQNKLTGPNYVDWKHNLDIVLIVEGHKYVLTEASPTDPSINVADAARQRFDR